MFVYFVKQNTDISATVNRYLFAILLLYILIIISWLEMYFFDNNIIVTNYDPVTYEGGVGYFCFSCMKQYKEKIAQILLSTSEHETYESLLLKCIRTSLAFRKMGIQKGDIITFCSDTNLNSCVPLIACFLIGAIPSYLDATFSKFDISYFVKSIDPKLFLVVPNHVETIRSILISQNRTTNIIIFNEDFFEPQEEESTFEPVYVNDFNETAIINFSSGTTGFPKGICINHNRFFNSLQSFSENMWRSVGPKIILSYDSFHWTVETVRLVCAIKDGVCRLVGSHESYLKNTWYFLEKYKVNVAFLIPLAIVEMLETGRPTDIFLTNLTTIYIEGSLLPAKYHDAIQKVLPNVDIFHRYGLTEVGAVTLFRKIYIHRKYNKEKPGCVGMPFPDFGMSLKIVDMESGESLGPNKRGELCVKSKSVMNGYHNLDSSIAFDADGWLKTGDVGYYDEEFCFFIVGRIKELIIYQGRHISPAILEAELLSHPAVKYAVVIGVPDERGLEVPMGLVVLNDNFGTEITREIEKYVEPKVSDIYRLRGGVRVVQESYLKTNSKVKRFKLKKLVMSGEI